MSELLFSDFPNEGSLGSGPISHVGGSPSSFKPSCRPIFSVLEVKAALQSGCRSKFYSRKILSLCLKLERKKQKFTERDISAVEKLAVKCMAVREFRKCFGIKKKASLPKGLSHDQRSVLDVLRAGSRSHFYGKEIREACKALPKEKTIFTAEDVAALVSLSVKCRSFVRVSSFLGYKREKRVYKPRAYVPRKRKFTDEQLKENNRRCARRWRKHKIATDPRFRILRSLRRRFREVLKGAKKSQRTLKLLGCSLDELKAHLEARWKPGMSWENYGVYGWHIDHIRPCASFNLLDHAQQAKCFHHTNLQPLWAKENIVKGANYDPFPPVPEKTDALFEQELLSVF